MDAERLTDAGAAVSVKTSETSMTVGAAGAIAPV